ncbi:MAG: DUF493 domain-containing protein [Pseudomonadota bacterium]
MPEPTDSQEPPKIEFPCDYPVKVLGRRAENFEARVLAVFDRHAPGYDREGMTIRDSRKGTFASITIVITATGPEQLKALHEDLLATGLVQMVL